MSKDASKTTKNRARKRINNPKPEPKETALKWVFVFTPFLLSLIFMLIKWISQGFVALPGIKWNDEVQVSFYSTTELGNGIHMFGFMCYSLSNIGTNLKSLNYQHTVNHSITNYGTTLMIWPILFPVRRYCS